MPTILEHLAALFDKDMRAVLNNPRAISMIANPSARVQMAAVRRDKSVICFIEGIYILNYTNCTDIKMNNIGFGWLLCKK